MFLQIFNKNFKCVIRILIFSLVIIFVLSQTTFKVNYIKTFAPETYISEEVVQMPSNASLKQISHLDNTENPNESRSLQTESEQKEFSRTKYRTDKILNVIKQVEKSKSDAKNERVLSNGSDIIYSRESGNNNSDIGAGSKIRSGYVKGKQTVIKNLTKSDEIKKLNGEPQIPTQPGKVIKKNLDKFIKCNNKIKTFQPSLIGKIGEEDEEKDLKFIRRHPNLPNFIIKPKNLSTLIPPIYNIRWSGSLYQESWKAHPNCHLYSANFDSRLPSGPIVRILGLCEIKFVTIDFFCQFWYNETENPVVSAVYEAGFPGRYVGRDVERKATMMSCKVPVGDGFKSPIAVSIVQKQCRTPTNIMKIGGSLSQKKTEHGKMNERNLTIGLCGKAIFFYKVDFSLRLIEWVEILRILGISKFFLYRTLSHENVEKVLDYYEKEGIAEVINFKHNNPYIEEGALFRTWMYSHISQFGSNERIYYNDCILKNKDNFDYLAIFDYDEIPILKKHKNLVDFLHYVKTLKGIEEKAAIQLRMKLLHRNLEPRGAARNISESLYVLRHNVRNPLDWSNFKSIYNTKKVLYVACHTLIAHNAVPPITNEVMTVSQSIAYTGHYKYAFCRNKCLEGPFVEENRLLEYASEVEYRMKKIREELKI